jgi:hypothetical protein
MTKIKIITLEASVELNLQPLWNKEISNFQMHNETWSFKQQEDTPEHQTLNYHYTSWAWPKAKLKVFKLELNFVFNHSKTRRFQNFKCIVKHGTSNIKKHTHIWTPNLKLSHFMNMTYSNGKQQQKCVLWIKTYLVIMETLVELNRSKMCTSFSFVRNLHTKTLKLHAWWTHKAKKNFKKGIKQI